MSKFVCGLSGEPVEEAVVSQVSGVVYEKRLIHKWIQGSFDFSLVSFKLERFLTKYIYISCRAKTWLTFDSICSVGVLCLEDDKIYSSRKSYVKENGTDPVNDQQLDTDQLVELKPDCLVKPKALFYFIDYFYNIENFNRT